MARRKRRLEKRIDKRTGFDRAQIQCGTVKIELAEKQQAVACGGLELATGLVKQVGLRQQINRLARVFKFWAPYQEADHVLNIVFNLLSDAACLEHLELRRNDEAYLDALEVSRIPDPTMAGGFCRRFDEFQILMAMRAIHQARRKFWKKQPDNFFACATIEADRAYTSVLIFAEGNHGLDSSFDKELINPIRPISFVTR